MEYTLKKLILSPQTSITDEMIQFILYQTLNAIYFMHSADITHRDLKPENLLIAVDGHVKIADFGLAKPLLHSNRKVAYSFCGSPEYMAPEMLLK